MAGLEKYCCFICCSFLSHWCVSVHVCVISIYGGEGGGIHFLIFAVLGWGCLFIIIIIDFVSS